MALLSQCSRKLLERDTTRKRRPELPFQIRGGVGVSTRTLGSSGADKMAALLSSPPQPGYAQRPRRSETTIIINGKRVAGLRWLNFGSVLVCFLCDLDV